MREIASGPPPRRIFEVTTAERALRCGMACRILDAGAKLAMAVETLPSPQLPAAAEGSLHLVFTGWRLTGLGFAVEPDGCFALPLDPAMPVAGLRPLVDPTFPSPSPLPFTMADLRPADRIEAAALELCKLAGLLPAALVFDAGREGEPHVAAEADLVSIFAYRDWIARSVQPVVEAEIPLRLAGKARFVAFRPADGGAEQYAILIGSPAAEKAPLCRLHSECLTGDLFGSLRCDCGEQLDGALRRMAEEGGGVLLYLRQEGRGIGLVNKLRAYRLQMEGLDTVDANIHLGFEPDERDFLVAATILERLGLGRIRLLTNNPGKVEALARHGITVTERVAHSFTANRHNQFYLETKARRSGHLIDLAPLRDRRRGRA